MTSRMHLGLAADALYRTTTPLRFSISSSSSSSSRRRGRQQQQQWRRSLSSPQLLIRCKRTMMNSSSDNQERSGGKQPERRSAARSASSGDSLPMGSSQLSSPSPPPPPMFSLDRLKRTLEEMTTLYPVFLASLVILGLTNPGTVTWFSGPMITYALAGSMLSMGLTIESKDVVAALRRLDAVALGVILQYTVMPCLGSLAAATYLTLAPADPSAKDIAAGIILVSCCPGGTASNICCFIAGADVALSVLMTSLSTLFAAILTPFLTKILAGAFVPINALELLVSTVQVVILPVVLGLLIQSFFPGPVKQISSGLPLLAALGASLISASVLAQNRDAVLLAGPAIIICVFLLHAGGFAIGFLLPQAFGIPERMRRTMSIEVGMQNSGLGVVLAQQHMISAPMAPVPCAISATLHSLIGSLLAAYWRGRKLRVESEERSESGKP